MQAHADGRPALGPADAPGADVTIAPRYSPAAAPGTETAKGTSTCSPACRTTRSVPRVSHAPTLAGAWLLVRMSS